MAFQKITENVENIITLSDTPALTPTELKKMFDKGNKTIKEYFNILVDELNNNLYPIGTGFIAYDDTDYTNHLGLKWERTLLGKTPVGKNEEEEFNTIGKTGGAKTHQLVVKELPDYSLGYEQGRLIAWVGAHNGNVATSNSQNQYSQNAWKDTEIMSKGKNVPHNNLQPYQVVNFWKRVS